MKPPTIILLILLICPLVLPQTRRTSSQKRPVSPPSPTQHIHTADGITSVYDESINTTLISSNEVLLYDDASQGAVNPLRVTMTLVTTYAGSSSTSSEAAIDPLIKLLFSYRYFVAKFDVGEPRDFAIFTGLSNLEASGKLSFIRRDNSDNQVITTMQASIRASELHTILEKIKTARSASFLIGRDSFVLTANHLEMFEKFLARTPHPAPQSLTPPSNCDLTVAQAPALRGFRLGQSLTDVLARFRSVHTSEILSNANAAPKTTRSLLDVIFSTYYALTAQTPAAGHKLTENWNEVLADSRFFPDFEGVSKLHLEFIEQQLIAIRVEYKNDIRWQTNDEFVAASATALGLATQWKTGPLLTCVGFTIHASSSFASILELRDTNAEGAARQREDELKKREEEKRKNTFKP
ncbi:MAG TPA: hypothetical protein VJ875_13080 [Pyrinomonadaceae bacterium]|nr:hypothetical protein [Pyrinomonadaceae bacterium]